MSEYLHFLPQLVSVLTVHTSLPFFDTYVKLFYITGVFYNSLYTPVLGRMVVDFEVKHVFPYSGIQCLLYIAESSVAFVRRDKQVKGKDKKGTLCL
jgi:hypothetical protein